MSPEYRQLYEGGCVQSVIIQFNQRDLFLGNLLYTLVTLVQA